MPGWRRHSHRLLVLAVAAWQVGLIGCRATEARYPGESAPPANDFLYLSSMAGNAPVQRGQKDEGVTPNPLELRPEDPGSRENRTARIRAIVCSGSSREAILDEEV